MEKINNDLVSLTTQDVGKAIPMTNSLVISKKIGYKHYRVTSLIKKHVEDFEEFGAITFEKCLLNSKNVDIILLNENQFLLLITYLRTSKIKPIIKELKKELIRQFSKMKTELLVRKETRHIGINARKSLTDSIKLNIDENTNFKKFAYSNYSKLVYKKVLGKTVKKAKEEIGLTSKDNIRNHFSIEQLEEVQKIESKIATWIEAWKDLEMTDKEVYAKIKEKLI